MIISHTKKFLSQMIYNDVSQFINQHETINFIYLGLGKYLIFFKYQDTQYGDNTKLFNSFFEIEKKHNINFYFSELFLLKEIAEYKQLLQSFQLLDHNFFYQQQNFLQDFLYTELNDSSDTNELYSLISSFRKNKNNQALYNYCFKNNIRKETLKSVILSFLYKNISEEKILSFDYSSKILASDTFQQTLELFSDYIDQKDTLPNYRFEVKTAINYISNNYMNDITLTSVAEQIYISPSYLSTIFKKDTGESFNHYLNKIRIMQAIILLETTNGKIYEIAKEVGIDSYRYFSTVFSKITGKTPREYQNKGV